ncbi:MAG: C25 family cysteine peptidase [Kouleothrix sp.]
MAKFPATRATRVSRQTCATSRCRRFRSAGCRHTLAEAHTGCQDRVGAAAAAGRHGVGARWPWPTTPSSLMEPPTRPATLPLWPSGRCAAAGPARRALLCARAAGCAAILPPARRAAPRVLRGRSTSAALVLYVGHGSIWRWAFTSPTAASPYLVSVYDAGVRTNGARLPLLLSMDCLSGNWANPTEPALDELLLLAGNGGVAAALTPAGSGVNSGHAQLLAGALPLLAAGQTLGAAQLAGLAAIARSGRDSDLLFSFGILGDPAVRLPALQDTLYLPFAAYRAPRP